MLAKFHENMESGEQGPTRFEVDSAQKNLSLVLQDVAALPGLAPLGAHVDAVIRSAPKECRNTEELQKYYDSVTEQNNFAARHEPTPLELTSRKGPRVLIVSGMAPSIKHGGGLRLFDIVSELPEKYEIDLYCRYRRELDKSSVDLLRPRLSSVRLVRKLRLGKLLDWVSNQSRRNGYYDIIQFEYPKSIKLIPHLARYTRRVGFTFMECHTRSLAIDLVAAINKDPSEIPPEICKRLILSLCAEASALYHCDFTIAVTEEDAAFCQAMGETAPAVIPHGVSSVILNDARETGISTNFNELRKAAVFVGYYGHPPNIDAVRWYLKYVHRAVVEKIPGYRVYIVGGGDTSTLKQEFKDDASIVFSGWVDRLGPWIAKGSICISPLISGAGLRGKINQYSAYKRPTVSTSIGISGIEYEDGKSVLIADDPIQFARSMVTLMQDRDVWSNILRGSQEVASNWMWPRVISEICNIYEEQEPREPSRVNDKPLKTSGEPDDFILRKVR